LCSIVAAGSEDETEIRTGKVAAQQVLKDIRRQTRRQYFAGEVKTFVTKLLLLRSRGRSHPGEPSAQKNMKGNEENEA
jgi:hypothetical protein